MADIKLYIPILKHWEGGFSDNPNDSGGATMCGVTLNVFRHFFGTNMSVEDLKNITEDQFITVLEEYWNGVQGDKILDQQVANSLVDWAYNAGETTPIKHLQGILNLPRTGFFGDMTLTAVNNANPQNMCNLIYNARVNFYKSLVNSTPKDSIFLRGWLVRATSFLYKPII